MKRQIELSVLWVLLVLGFLAHTLADVMPAFWGESIVAMPTSANWRELIALMMGISYTLPVLAIFLTIMPLMAIVGIILAVKSIKYVREKLCVESEEDDNEEEEDENVGNEEEESEEEVSEEKGEEVSEKEEKEAE